MEKELLADAKDRMEKAVSATKIEFNSVRSGRASTALLDRITVDYYGTRTPLKQLANIAVPEPRLLVVQPYDKTRHEGHREGHPRLRPGHQPVQRRPGDPPADPASHRGAPPRDWSSWCTGWRKTAAWPSATCAATP